MPKARNRVEWTRHYGAPQIPIVITHPMAFVQIKEDAVRGRCRFSRAIDVDWTRVTHWRFGRR